VVALNVKQRIDLLRKRFPRQFTKSNPQPRKAYFKRRPQNSKAKATTCFICQKPGHWASQCPLRTKTKFQSKIMDLFQTGYDPAEWEMVSDRSDGEFLSLTEDDESIPSSPDSQSDSDESQITENLNFLDIKMMSPTSDLPSLLQQRSTLEHKLSLLTPGQFQLSKRYNAQISLLTAQIAKIQQPSVVNIQNYTPKDSEFVPPQPKASKQVSQVRSFKHMKEIREEEDQEEDSLDKTIHDLEESIKEKEALISELWKSLKMEKEELNFLRTKRDEQWEREMFNHDTEIESSEFKQINGLEDRLVISVDIKVSGYLTACRH
jgi:hypothetical protein